MGFCTRFVSRKANTTSSAAEPGRMVPVTWIHPDSIDSRAQDMSPKATATPRGADPLAQTFEGAGWASSGSRT